jgi:hypothetical protein
VAALLCEERDRPALSSEGAGGDGASDAAAKDEQFGPAHGVRR